MSAPEPKHLPKWIETFQFAARLARRRASCVTSQEDTAAWLAVADYLDGIAQRLRCGDVRAIEGRR